MGRATLRVGLLDRIANVSDQWGLIMTMSSLTPSDQTTASKEVIATSAIRTLVAKHFGVSLGRVTDEMHFTQDLGADWLDRLAFMMAVEEQFAGLEITDGHLEKFLSPSRHESDSVTARGHGRMERAGHGAEGLFRC